MPMPTPSVTRLVSSATTLAVFSSALGTSITSASPTSGTNTASVKPHSWNQFISRRPLTEDGDREGNEPNGGKEEQCVALEATRLQGSEQAAGLVRLPSEPVDRAVDDALVEVVQVVLVDEEAVAGLGCARAGGETLEPAQLLAVEPEEQADADRDDHDRERDRGEADVEVGLHDVREPRTVRLDVLLELLDPERRRVGQTGHDAEPGEHDERSGDRLGRLVRVVVAPVLAEEREPDAARHVRGGQEGADEADDHEDLVPALARRGEDLVLGPEPGEREDAGERERADHERPERDRHELAQPTHVLLHVEGVVGARVADRAGAEEQQRLEE